MATKEEMAAKTAQEQKDFGDAWGDDTARSEPSEDEAFGITPSNDPGEDGPSTEGASSTQDGAAPAVVIVAEEPAAAAQPGQGDAAAEASLNEEGAENAKAATDAANEKAGTDARSDSTGSQEAGPEGSAAEEAAETPAIEAAEVESGEGDASQAAADGADAPDAADGTRKPMTEQQLRSWEGRLRKVEADLKAKADAAAAGGPEQNGPVADGTNTESQAADALEQVADEAGDKGQTALEQAAGDAADKVESGEMTPEQAMASLAEDFGEGFVRMIEVIAKAAAGKTADEKVAGVNQAVEDVIGHIKDSAEQAHFEAIFQAHPDFYEISKSPEFDAFVAAGGAEAKQIVEDGSAAQINKLLADFKAKVPAKEAAQEAAAQPADEAAAAGAADGGASDDDIDAAEGVRSGGLQLPEEPRKAADDYEGAWKEF